MFSKKGFIGPIGDDLPSLVPIVVALVIFFSIFTLTLNTYNSKNAFISKQLDMASVAREIKGDSLILGIDQFEKRCSSIQSKRFPYNFIIGIYGADVSLENISYEFAEIALNNYDAYATSNTLISQPNFEDSERIFFCAYNRIGSGEFSIEKKKYSLRFYPVAVQQPIRVQVGGTETEYSLTIPAVMAMVVWE